MEKFAEKFRIFMRKRNQTFKIMKLSVFLMLIGMMQVSANVYSQAGKLNVRVNQVALSDLLWDLQENSDIVFVYKTKDMVNFPKVSIDMEGVTVTEILDELLLDSDLEYIIDNDVVVIKKKLPRVIEEKPIVVEEQKELKLKGIVTDTDGNTLPGVSVVVKGTTNGVATDIDGKYTIQFENKNAVLVFSFVGMSAKEVKYTGQISIDVQLTADSEQMDEVVVTGYFTRKKDSYTGAVTSITGEDLKLSTTGSVLSALTSLDPSFAQVIDNSKGSDPNSMPDFVIRGSGSITSESGSLRNDYEGNPNSPTFIMDGFEVSAVKVFDLEPSRVKSITILKDAAATAIYGSRAANGVVVIETEEPKIGELRVSYRGSLDFEVADLSDYNLMLSLIHI